jgi:hypothetical protein
MKRLFGKLNLSARRFGNWDLSHHYDDYSSDEDNDPLNLYNAFDNAYDSISHGKSTIKFEDALNLMENLHQHYATTIQTSEAIFKFLGIDMTKEVFNEFVHKVMSETAAEDTRRAARGLSTTWRNKAQMEQEFVKKFRTPRDEFTCAACTMTHQRGDACSMCNTPNPNPDPSAPKKRGKLLQLQPRTAADDAFEQCPICREPMNDATPVIGCNGRIPRGAGGGTARHWFHRECIQPLCGTGKCPTCRVDLTSCDDDLMINRQGPVLSGAVKGGKKTKKYKKSKMYRKSKKYKKR